MKKCSFIVICICVCLLFWACTPFGESELGEFLGISVEKGTVVESFDDHGGFQGDGTTYQKIVFSKEDSGGILAEIQENTVWKPFPLTQNLYAVLYGGEIGDVRYGPHFQDDNGSPLLPVIENGYYFFCDRHSKSTDSTDDAGLFDRGSYNFTLAVYDTDTNILYYLELDT